MDGTSGDWRKDPGLGALDAFAILLGAAALTLFLLWLATALNGQPLAPEVPQVLRDVVSSFWSWLATGGTSILLWSLSRRVSGSAYLVWTVGLAFVFVTAAVGLSVVLAGRKTGWLARAERNLPFEAFGPRLAVGCEDNNSSRVDYAVPDGAYEVQRFCEWVQVDDLKTQSCETSLSGTTVSANGNIRGRDREWTGNCPGGGHGTLRLYGSYKIR